MRIPCSCEQHTGNENLFLLADAHQAAQEFLKTYKGSVQLIYLDPPFQTGGSFSMSQRVGEKSYSRGRGLRLELQAYQDERTSEEYYAMMRQVLEDCRELLREDGSLFLHIDYRTSAHLRLMLDEIFGASNFVNEIIWHYKSGGRAVNHFSRKHDTIFFYRKGKKHYFNLQAVGTPRGKEQRSHLKRTVDESGRVCYSIKSGGKIYTYYEDSVVFPCDVWEDISHLQQKDPERTGYDTQKPEALLNRILLSASRPGDLICDLFSGSGTTAAAAFKLGRRFLAADSCPLALHVLRKRLLSRQPTLFDPGDPPFCARLMKEIPPCFEPSFSVCQLPGGLSVSLQDYAVPRENLLALPGSQSLDFVDYWAIGTFKQEVFYPYAHSMRTLRSGTLSKTLSIPAKEHVAVHIVDVLGQQGFFPVS